MKHNKTPLLFIFLITHLSLFPNTQDKPKHHVLFAHGFSGSKMSFLYFTKGHEELISLLAHKKPPAKPLEYYLFDTNVHSVHSFNFPDVQIDLGMNGSIPNPSKANLAQSEDIQALLEALEAVPSSHIIGFGLSRGAATWLTTLGTQKTNKTIDALILESPFATTKEVTLYTCISNGMQWLKSIVSTLDIKKACKDVFESIFGGHNIDGITPIQTVATIPQEIPIMLVHSAEDIIIPINHTRELYIELKKTGHHNVYLVELDHGSHADLIRSKRYAKLYSKAVHAFYKQYKLPYDTALAEGIDLQVFQPSIETVMQRITQASNQNRSDTQQTKTLSWSATLNIF